MHPEFFPILGLFGIALPTLIGAVGGELFGGSTPGGCTTSGPQQVWRNWINGALSVLASGTDPDLVLDTVGVPLPGLENLASGSDQMAFDCPELQASAQKLLDGIASARVNRRATVGDPSGQFREEILGAAQETRTAGPTSMVTAAAMPLLMILGVAAAAFIGFKLAKS